MSILSKLMSAAQQTEQINRLKGLSVHIDPKCSAYSHWNTLCRRQMFRSQPEAPSSTAYSPASGITFRCLQYTRAPRIRPVPLPAESTTALSIEEVLQSTGYKSPQDLHLTLDLRWSPCLVRLGSTAKLSHAVPQEILTRSVSNLTRGSLRLHCESLAWCIDIPARRHGYVVIQDLLSGLYEALRTPVTRGELQQLRTHRSRWQQAVAALQFRCQSSQNRREEERVGMRRVDVLGDAYLFGGLFTTADGRLFMKTLKY
ncbi:hypothetical protein BDW22DRAFT_864002 [Trametopsis cervina]|nr:hypothetical protein BDW22DRAFT_864002 [Trametopsis cervina]